MRGHLRAGAVRNVTLALAQARERRAAGLGGADTADVATALRMVLMLGGVECRPK
jgi:hypothetical protein